MDLEKKINKTYKVNGNNGTEKLAIAPIVLHKLFICK